MSHHNGIPNLRVKATSNTRGLDGKIGVDVSTIPFSPDYTEVQQIQVIWVPPFVTDSNGDQVTPDTLGAAAIYTIANLPASILSIRNGILSFDQDVVTTLPVTIDGVDYFRPRISPSELYPLFVARSTPVETQIYTPTRGQKIKESGLDSIDTQMFNKLQEITDSTESLSTETLISGDLGDLIKETFTGLEDTDVDTPAGSKPVGYGTDSKWVELDITTRDYSDVKNVGATPNQTLTWDGTEWAPDNQSAAPLADVNTVLGQSGVVELGTSDVTNDAGFITDSALPTNVSSFTNDANYLTALTAPVTSFNGQSGTPSAVLPTTIGAMSDFTYVGGLTSSDYVVWDGLRWTNGTPTEEMPSLASIYPTPFAYSYVIEDVNTTKQAGEDRTFTPVDGPNAGNPVDLNVPLRDGKYKHNYGTEFSHGILPWDLYYGWCDPQQATLLTGAFDFPITFKADHARLFAGASENRDDEWTGSYTFDHVVKKWKKIYRCSTWVSLPDVAQLSVSERPDPAVGELSMGNDNERSESDRHKEPDLRSSAIEDGWENSRVAMGSGFGGPLAEGDSRVATYFAEEPSRADEEYKPMAAPFLNPPSDVYKDMEHVLFVKYWDDSRANRKWHWLTNDNTSSYGDYNSTGAITSGQVGWRSGSGTQFKLEGLTDNDNMNMRSTTSIMTQHCDLAPSSATRNMIDSYSKNANSCILAYARTQGTGYNSIFNFVDYPERSYTYNEIMDEHINGTETLGDIWRNGGAHSVWLNMTSSTGTHPGHTPFISDMINPESFLSTSAPNYMGDGRYIFLGMNPECEWGDAYDFRGMVFATFEYTKRSDAGLDVHPDTTA